MSTVIAFSFLAGVALPPREFDHAPTMPVSEYVVPIARMADVCGANRFACSIPLPGKCIVVVPQVEAGIISEPQQQRLRRHEYGHCNGWGRDHDGARP